MGGVVAHGGDGSRSGGGNGGETACAQPSPPACLPAHRRGLPCCCCRCHRACLLMCSNADMEDTLPNSWKDKIGGDEQQETVEAKL